MSQNKYEDYLGDGVYVSWDGYQIILDLRGQDNFTKIALDDQTLVALDRYRAYLKERLASLTGPSEMDADSHSSVIEPEISDKELIGGAPID